MSTEMSDDDDLPPLCHTMAVRKKGESKWMILQQVYNVTKEELNLGHLPASPLHVLDPDMWDLFGTSTDALGICMLPMSITPPDAPSNEAQKVIAEDQDRARQCDMSGEVYKVPSLQPT